MDAFRVGLAFDDCRRVRDPGSSGFDRIPVAQLAAAPFDAYGPSLSPGRVTNDVPIVGHTYADIERAFDDLSKRGPVPLAPAFGGVIGDVIQERLPVCVAVRVSLAALHLVPKDLLRAIVPAVDIDDAAEGIHRVFDRGLQPVPLAASLEEFRDRHRILGIACRDLRFHEVGKDGDLD